MTEVIDIARWRWLISFPTQKAMQTKERSEAFKEARVALKEIARGGKEAPKIEIPTAPITITGAQIPAQVASRQKREFTRRKMRGL